mmetsp:Transcript_29988/g.72756  ORF Transcript_29988/g.72756 Transcript_29988/m.72756 type:complete len:301 (+) Transcript_29988:148-1050(+)
MVRRSCGTKNVSLSAVLLLLACFHGVEAWSSSSSSSRLQTTRTLSRTLTTSATRSSTTLLLAARTNNHDDDDSSQSWSPKKLSPSGFFLPLLMSSAVMFSTVDIPALPSSSSSWAVAEDEVVVTSTTPASSPKYSIEKCGTTAKASQCVSSSNVRQLDLYAAPWTFSDSLNADEVMSRLKGAIVYDTSTTIVQQDGSEHLVVEAKRDLFGNKDTIEFVINGQDNVVTFRSETTADSDFGYQQRRRLDDIRKRAGIFGVMGDTFNSADSVTTGERGNGPLGQLKAFYGLQSGGGFEDVLAE